MDNVHKVELENPYKKSNVLSKLFFGWMYELISKGSKKKLEIIDLYKAVDNDESKTLGDKLEKNWDNEVCDAKINNRSPSLLRALSKTFFLSYMLWGIPYFIQFVILRTLLPMTTAHLISLYGVKKDASKTEMYISSIVLVAMCTLAVLITHHTCQNLSVIGMRVRIATSSLVYRTITKLDKTSLNKVAAGQVVNLLSNDVRRFDIVSTTLHCLWTLPFQIALVTFLLWQHVQISCLAGVLAMTLLILPAQVFLSKFSSKLRRTISELTDKRVKLMNEVISGIQVIKMYTWEKSFEKLIEAVRKTEVDVITKSSYLRGIVAGSTVFIERTALFLTIICYVLSGNTITAEKVFSMAQLFNMLQTSMVIYLPTVAIFGSEALISVSRLQAFLLLRKRKINVIETLKDNRLQLENVSASWTRTSATLKGITVQIPAGSLCAIIGPVGAGKSSLLQLLLGELSAESGKVSIGGEISHSSQEPWLFSSTARNNILFGQPYDKLRYKEVVKVCCLEKDFEQFPQGDKTLVGERGLTLSGGQRARINLARAVYRQADIYIMDDPLSAVDTLVGRQIFEKCINEHLEGTTRILVTHQLQYLKQADLIVVVNKGMIEAQGTFTELSNCELDFTQMLANANETNGQKELKTSETSEPSQSKNVLSPSCVNYQDSSSKIKVSDHNKSPFKEYVKAAKSIMLSVTVFVLLFVSQAVFICTDYWLALWTQQEETRYSSDKNLKERIVNQVDPFSTNTPYNGTLETNNGGGIFDNVELNNVTNTLLKTDYAMTFYGILIIFVISLGVMRSIIFFKLCMRASTNLHTTMFHKLLKAPMRFFDTSTSGSILNRFSKDMGAIDELFPIVLWLTIQISLILCGILVNVSVSNPYMMIAILILGCVFFKLCSWYISTVKQVKRLESAAKSPVFSHVDSTLIGLTTIRASKLEELLIDEFDKHQDVHTAAYYLTISSTYSFGLWFDMLCTILTACVAFGFIVVHTSISPVSDSLVGLAISQCLMMTGMLQYGMRQTAEVIQQLISVERVMQYTTVEAEGDFQTPQDAPSLTLWPCDGHIEFKNMSLRYVTDDPPVLRNINFVVQPGEKIGIVGRTGAGKSSLISALFRLASMEGSIYIDGLDTKTIGLTDLRKKISIIPQEPVLFSASLRYNLDPFNESEDETIWKALEQVELREAVDSLDFMVTEGGNNFSSGQKQLICLARALLRKNKILVLDEATANVDQRTDSFIQETIRKKFKNCTVLTIAHRLNTIMDSDKVLVLSFGEILEFGCPYELLGIPGGHFHGMILETGPIMALQLTEIAQEAHKKKHVVLRSESAD